MGHYFLDIQHTPYLKHSKFWSSLWSWTIIIEEININIISKIFTTLTRVKDPDSAGSVYFGQIRICILEKVCSGSGYKFQKAVGSGTHISKFSGRG